MALELINDIARSITDALNMSLLVIYIAPHHIKAVSSMSQQIMKELFQIIIESGESEASTKRLGEVLAGRYCRLGSRHFMLLCGASLF